MRRALILFIVTALCLLGAFLATDRPLARYQEYPCQFAMIYGSSGPVDVAVIGNSRGMLAVDSKILSETLAAAGQPGSVVNLSKSWRGAEFLYQLGKDLLSRHEVDLLLVEYNLAKSPAVRYHERTPFFLRLHELIRLALNEDRDGLYRNAARALRWFLDRFTLRTELLITGKFKLFTEQRVGAGSPVPATLNCPHSPPAVNAEANLNRRAVYPPDWQTRTLSWDSFSRDERLNTLYLKRLAELARDRGSEVMFFHVPEYLEPPLAEDLVAQVTETMGAPLLRPPLALQDALFQPGQFHDPTHLTPPATRVFSQWLGSAIEAARLDRRQ